MSWTAPLPEVPVVLVDRHDQITGSCGKLEAHREGHLHRAISVFVFNSQGMMLLQRRHPDKYHSGGLWSNTCCSHPLPGEDVQAAAARRLQEEMGITCELRGLFQFIYRAGFPNGLIEHELDHVFAGLSDADPLPDAVEVDGWQWIDTGALSQDIQERPERYTFWFRISLDRVLLHVSAMQLVSVSP